MIFGLMLRWSNKFLMKWDVFKLIAFINAFRNSQPGKLLILYLKPFSSRTTTLKRFSTVVRNIRFFLLMQFQPQQSLELVISPHSIYESIVDTFKIFIWIFHRDQKDFKHIFWGTMIIHPPEYTPGTWNLKFGLVFWNNFSISSIWRIIERFQLKMLPWRIDAFRILLTSFISINFRPEAALSGRLKFFNMTLGNCILGFLATIHL